MNENEEIQRYVGLFSQNRSTDIVSKIVLNIFIFTGIVIIVSFCSGGVVIHKIGNHLPAETASP